MLIFQEDKGTETDKGIKGYDTQNPEPAIKNLRIVKKNPIKD